MTCFLRGRAVAVMKLCSCVHIVSALGVGRG